MYGCCAMSHVHSLVEFGPDGPVRETYAVDLEALGERFASAELLAAAARLRAVGA